MAENKYDLWTKPPSTRLTKTFPWYTERLRQKYLPLKPSGALIAKDWVFVRKGGDDYRTGIPRETHSAESYLTYKDGSRHPTQIPRHLPTLNKKPKTDPKRDQLLDLYTMAYSKRVPRKEKQIENINMIEKSLTDHPLAVFPHYENSVSPELFAEVIETLDPELRPNSESESMNSESDEFGGEEEEEERLEQQEILSTAHDETSSTDLATQSFQWYPRNDLREDDNSLNGITEHSTSITATKIQEVTKDFCDWVKDLGGETVNNIEESTIFSLFASGYETKPALSVPIHVVQLSEVPFDLRNGTVNATELPSLLQYAVKNLTIKRGDTPSKRSATRTNKLDKNYGAWYLPVDLWKHRNNKGGLNDPKVDTLKTISEAKLKSKELDTTLVAMHGAMSFNDFIERKKVRKPDFLDGVNAATDDCQSAANEVP